MNTRTSILILIVIGIFIAFVVLRPQAPAAPALPQSYSNSAMKFSLQLPDGFTTDESYTYTEIGPGEEIKGVKFTIPLSMATGTNLSSDSYISVEQIPDAPSCIAGPFLWKGQKITLSPMDDVTQFLVASSTGAAAGNRYENAVFAQQDTNPCIAVRYYIHFASIENYPPGTVREYDQQALLSTFDAIRRSLRVEQ